MWKQHCDLYFKWWVSLIIITIALHCSNILKLRTVNFCTFPGEDFLHVPTQNCTALSDSLGPAGCWWPPHLHPHAPEASPHLFICWHLWSVFWDFPDWPEHWRPLHLTATGPGGQGHEHLQGLCHRQQRAKEVVYCIPDHHCQWHKWPQASI